MAPTGLGHGCSKRPNPFVERSFWRSHIYWRWEKDLNIFLEEKEQVSFPPFPPYDFLWRRTRWIGASREREKVQSHPRILCTAFGGIAERERVSRCTAKLFNPQGRRRRRRRSWNNIRWVLCCSSPNARAPSSSSWSCVYVRYFPNSQMGWKSAANWRGDVARPMRIRQRVCCVNNGTLPAIRDRHPRPIVRNWPRWRTGVDATRPLHHLPGMCEGETVDDDCCAYSIAMQQRVDYPHTHTHTRTPPDNQNPWGNFSGKEEEEVVIPPTDHVTLGRVEIYRPMNHIRNDFIFFSSF